MSYILDALRKADAQRARDPARGIHAQAAPVAMPADTRRRRNVLVAGVAAGVLVVVAAWMWFSPAPVPARSVAIAPVPSSVARIEAPAAPQPPPPATEVFPPAPEPVAAAPAPRPAPTAAASAPAPVAARGASAAASAAAAPVAERTYSLTELPADVQQALPKFSVSGGVYSENVAQRMLVVNGQVFNEGSEIATGVVLEQIRPRVALLKFRGLRIAQPY